MSLNDRTTAISSFIEWLGVPQAYTMHYRALALQREGELGTKYFPKISDVTDQQAVDLVRRMQTNIVENSFPSRHKGDHGLLEEWKRCCHGIAWYILMPGTTFEIDPVPTAEVVCRLSGYVHHGAALFHAFRSTARTIADEIWIKHGIDVPHIPIPDKWQETICHDLANEEGYLDLWSFAGCQRKLASRILCHLADRNYRDIYLTPDDKAEILAQYQRARQQRIEENILSRWSVASKFVDELTQAMIVNATRLELYLEANDFDQNLMTNPNLQSREQWLRRIRTAH